MSIKKFLTYSFIFTSILGTFLHFTYELSNNNVIVSLFSPINESVWEHLKLLYFPMLISTLFGSYYYRNDIPNFLCSKTIGILVSLLFTVVFFYTYSGVLGTNVAVIDILTFYIAAFLGEYVSYKLMKKPLKCNNSTVLVVLGILLICFIVFTFKTPNIGIFENPVE